MSQSSTFRRHVSKLESASIVAEEHPAVVVLGVMLSGCNYQYRTAQWTL